MSRRLTPLVGTLALLVAFAIPSPAAANKVPCSGLSGCTIHLHAESKVRYWSSKTRKSWNDREIQEIRVVVEGEAIPGSTVNECMAEFSGEGVTLRFNVCAANRIQLRWVAWTKERDLIVYVRL